MPATVCTTCYLSQDHLGSTRLVTDAVGNMVALRDFFPFGAEVPAGMAGRSGADGTTDNVNVKFTGQYRDSETGSDFFDTRYLGNSRGRFLTPDPAGNVVADLTNPRTWNLYGFVWNNPLNNVDPAGLDPISLA